MGSAPSSDDAASGDLIIQKSAAAARKTGAEHLSIPEALWTNVVGFARAPLQSLNNLRQGRLPSGTVSDLQNAFVTNGYIPDRLLIPAIQLLIRQRVQTCHSLDLEQLQAYKMKFVQELKTMPIALMTNEANEQHYEVPYGFYQLVLGQRLKYSSCYYADLRTESLEQGEKHMFELYRTRAQLQDGQRVLDVGCGWGSLSLYFAAAFPRSHFTAVSNSATQKELIDQKAKQLGLTNVTVITCDINTLKADQLMGQPGKEGGVLSGQFDRIMSIEMMEHCKNYDRLFSLLSRVLKPTGKMFVHIFVSREYPYHFDDDSWMTKYFFAGGTMPSEDLFHYFNADLRVVHQWRVNGQHYARTLQQWLDRMDAHRPAVLAFFEKTYGSPTAAWRWYNMWRMFFLSCVVFFGWNRGEEFFVAHYLFEQNNQKAIQQ